MRSDAEILAVLAGLAPSKAALSKLEGVSSDEIRACLSRATLRAEGIPKAVAPSDGDGSAPTRLRLYSDGAARGNPGPAGAGAVLMTTRGDIVAELGRYLGSQTNNFAEYQGLILGLRKAAELGARDLEVFSDSQLLVRQLEGVYRVRHPGLKPLFEEAQRLLRLFPKVHVHHIPRELNTAADEMSNRAIDERL
jgi:ribonuclease HI